MDKGEVKRQKEIHVDLYYSKCVFLKKNGHWSSWGVCQTLQYV